MKKLSKIFRGLVYILPAVLIFSYYPIISFGASETMNFELSLPLIWLLIFDVISAVIFILQRDFSFFKKWQWLLFPIFATVSLAWSYNFTRGILTVGILWLVVFAVFAILRLRKIFYDERGFYYTFLKFFFGSAMLICVWCVAQCIMDIAGVSREVTLLCRGCVYGMFGFPHPNGFAIEPQFMGNLLLAPTLVAAWLLMKKNKNLKRESSRGRVFDNGSVGPASKLQFRTRAVTVVKNTSGSDSLCLKFLFFFIASALFLTFSRGAIYAFVVAMIFMSVASLRSKDRPTRDHKLGRTALSVSRVGWFRTLGKTWLTIVLAFLFSLNLQGVMAQVSPTNDTYFSGVSKALNHLSLGIIDMGGRVETPVDGEANENDSEFDGYVEESTNIRLGLTKRAAQVWLKDFKTAMFGVGIGGAGQAMYDAGLIDSPKEIVQNEYASILLETGLIGFLIIIFTIVMILKIIRKNPISIIILTLGVAYGVSLLFFSGFANALQIYLLPPVIYIVFLKKFVS